MTATIVLVAGSWPKRPAVAWDQQPDRRTRRTYLHLLWSCAQPFGPATLR